MDTTESFPVVFKPMNFGIFGKLCSNYCLLASWVTSSLCRELREDVVEAKRHKKKKKTSSEATYRV